MDVEEGIALLNIVWVGVVTNDVIMGTGRRVVVLVVLVERVVILAAVG